MKSKMRYRGWTSGRSLTVVSGVLAVLFLSGLIRIGRAQDTPSYTVLHGFTGLVADGLFPLYSGVVRDAAGNLYGATFEGGAQGRGTVFKLDRFGRETALHSFAGGTDGAYPTGGLIRDGAGNLYGSTEQGGDTSCNCGTVFKVDAAGSEIVLYAFTGGTDGAGPYASTLSRDTAGNLYGTTQGGGSTSCNCGTVFKVDAAGKESVLHAFEGGMDGEFPQGAVIRDAAGNLYGTTYQGGDLSCNCGSVFKLDAAGNETVLYAFTGGNDGANPAAGVI